MSRRSVTGPVVLSIGLGFLAGYGSYELAPDAATRATMAGVFSTVSDVFLRLVRTLIAPMVLGSIVAGIGGMDHLAAARRIGLKAAAWFAVASVLSIGVGFAVISLLPEGLLSLQPASGPSPSMTLAPAPTLQAFLTHVVPRSIFEALATNETLQVATFAVGFGIALSAVKGVLSNHLLGAIEEFVIVMLRLTDLVMRLAPIAAFAATASVTATRGFGVLAAYGTFVGGVFAGLLVISVLTCAVAYVVLGRELGTLLRLLREPIALGFATASSEAAFPRLMEQLDGHGISHRLTGMVLPLAYAFNLCGSMVYLSFSVLFLAHAYHVPLTVGGEIGALALIFLFSKGMAGVPRASLVVLAAVLPQVGVPPEAVLLLLGIDQFVDMGRTAVNVLCNGLATAVIGRWEQQRAMRPGAVPAGRGLVVVRGP